MTVYYSLVETSEATQARLHQVRVAYLQRIVHSITMGPVKSDNIYLLLPLVCTASSFKLNVHS